MKFRKKDAAYENVIRRIKNVIRQISERINDFGSRILKLLCKLSGL